MYKIKCFNNSIDKQQSFERHCSDTHAHFMCLGWEESSHRRITNPWLSINQQVSYRFFFCKLGNKIWFLLVMCINWAYEAQWGHVWSSRRPLSVTVERAAQLTNQIWFDSKIHSVSTNSMESTVTSEPRVWVRGGELYHTLLLNYREWTEANQLKLKVNG